MDRPILTHRDPNGCVYEVYRDHDGYGAVVTSPDGNVKVGFPLNQEQSEIIAQAMIQIRVYLGKDLDFENLMRSAKEIEHE